MNADAILKRLTAIASEIEERETAIWLLQQERDELRGQLRRVMNCGSPAGPSAPNAVTPSAGRSEPGLLSGDR